MTKYLFYPMIFQILLTVILVFRLGFTRLKAFKSGHMKGKELSLGQDVWNIEATKAHRSFQNQFEIPVLFYTAILAASFIQMDSKLFLSLAWIFVITRFFHAYEHTGRNYVPARFRYFTLGFFSVTVMWIIFTVHLVFSELK